jgi:hypothetical protein
MTASQPDTYRGAPSPATQRGLTPSSVALRGYPWSVDLGTLESAGLAPSPAPFELRPLLYGPSDEILAGTYQRSSEASVWLLPSDLIGDLRAWLVAAFREWHQLYPKRFPAVADWTRAADWATPTEADLMRQVHDADQALERARAEHEATVAAPEDALSVARADGDAYERALLTGLARRSRSRYRVR